MANPEQKKWPVITCPHCGYQYAPAEIFMPGDLIGNPEQVIRDALGKIIYQEYDEESEPEYQLSMPSFTEGVYDYVTEL